MTERLSSLSRKVTQLHDGRQFCSECGGRVRPGKTHRCLTKNRVPASTPTRSPSSDLDESIDYEDDDDTEARHSSIVVGNLVGALSDLNDMVHIPKGRRK